MKIVITANPEQSVPPIKYGGTQRRTDFIARGLVARGHKILLICGPGSTCPVSRVITETAHMSQERGYPDMLKKVEDWDCLLDMTAFHIPSLRGDPPGNTKTLAMMSGDPYKKYPHNGVRNRVYVSAEFARFNECPNHPVLLNIPTDRPWDVPLGSGSGGYCLYVGTVRPEKGVHLAASACRRLDIPLKVAGPVQPRFAAYWDTFKNGIDYVGEVGNEKWELIGGATALLFPSLWCDASPLVVKEALLCGTPVLACPNGGVIEDINESNGLLVQPGDLTTGLYDIIQRVWDRSVIQKAAVEKMDPVKYIDDLEALLTRVSKGDTW